MASQVAQINEKRKGGREDNRYLQIENCHNKENRQMQREEAFEY